MITIQDLQSLTNAALSANYSVNIDNLILEVWEAGLETHVPRNLRKNYAAIYIFNWQDRFLKVGKVNANSNARYLSQHYNANSSNSNLSKSLINDQSFRELIGETPPGIWLKQNTTRYNILISTQLSKNFVTFSESFFILKCNPIFEDGR